MPSIVIGTVTLTDATVTFHPGADFHQAPDATKVEMFRALADFFENLAVQPAANDATQVSSDGAN